MTGKMETAFYHDDTPSLPNYGQMSDYERYQSHKVLSKKGVVSSLSHVFPDQMGSTPGLKLLQGQSVGNCNINPNSIGINTTNSMLASADINLLKLSSPDLEQLIIQSNQGLVTTSPGPSCAGSPFVYRSQETSEQEGFADGFVKALADLHKQNQLISAPISPSSSVQGPYQRNIIPPGEMPIYTNMSGYNPSQISTSASYPGNHLPYASSSHASGHSGQGHGAHAHSRGLDAAQIVPEMPHPPGESGGSPPTLSPIDLETQERIKVERKKLRNRIAASKCRKRKLERISRLEEKVKVLKTQNCDLATAAGLLREQVAQLKERVMDHVTSGCQIAVGPPGVAKHGESTSC